MKYRIRNVELNQYIDEKYHKDYSVDMDGDVCSPIAIETIFKDGTKSIEVKNSNLINQKNYIPEFSLDRQDINGIELFEGDIYKTTDDVDLIGVVVNLYMIHEFKKIDYSTKLIYNGGCGWIKDRIKLCGFEIIGNIHDTPREDGQNEKM
jgi:hypothetical protein